MRIKSLHIIGLAYVLCFIFTYGYSLNDFNEQRNHDIWQTWNGGTALFAAIFSPLYWSYKANQALFFSDSEVEK